MGKKRRVLRNSRPCYNPGLLAWLIYRLKVPAVNRADHSADIGSRRTGLILAGWKEGRYPSQRTLLSVRNLFYRETEISICVALHFANTIYKLEIRSVERGICPIATSTMNELFSYNYGAWTKGLYFHFWSKIWRHHLRVSWPRFPLRRENFGDWAINKR